MIGSGVLEHVPNDNASLQELYRIIKTGGYLIITMLPNKLSWIEFLNRVLRNPHHLRLYDKKQIQELLIHNGFLPETHGYHVVLPTLSSLNGGIFDNKFANYLVSKSIKLNILLEKIWPFYLFSTNIYIVSKKVDAFHG